MKNKNLYISSALLAATILITGCSTVLQPKDIDPATGRIQTKSSITATVVHSEKIDMSKYQDLILVLGGDFFKEQTIKFGYFKTVVNRPDMEKLLIQENKSDIVSDVTNLLSWKKIADNYKPFLVLGIDTRVDGSSRFGQLKVIQADTGKEVFIAEVPLPSMVLVGPFFVHGANDDNVYYPIYNSFIDWVNSNK